MKTLTLENYQELQPYIEMADYKEYNSNTMTMLMWSSMYEVHFETYEDYAIAYTCMPGRSPVWLMPYGRKEARYQAVEKIRERSNQLMIPFEIHSMTREFKDWLMRTYPDEFLIWDCYDARDYVYDRKQQETLSGKKMQKRRNHFNAFVKEYEGRFVYKKLEVEDLPAVYAFLSQWQSMKEEDDSIDAEDAGIHTLLSHLQELPIMGGCIYVDGKLEAFNIASRLSSDMIQIHVEKANRSIRGLYIAILKLFLETLEDGILYVNREDDMGLETLRKAKSDMQPIFKIRKFGSCVESLTIRKAEDEDLPEIKALWLRSFHEETKESTEFFFNKMYHNEDCWILRSKEELISMMQLRKMKISLHKQEEDVSFIVGVATNPDYEGCGYMKRLMNHVLALIGNKERFTLLQAYNWDLYKPFGFEETYARARIKADTKVYTQPKGELTHDVNSAVLHDLYDTYTRDKEGYRIRSQEYYETMIEYKRIWNQQVLVHVIDKIPTGYVILSEEDEEIQVQECIYTSDISLHAMISLLCESGKKVYLYTALDSKVEGRRKELTNMMVKAHTEEEFPVDNLFINEEI